MGVYTFSTHMSAGYNGTRSWDFPNYSYAKSRAGTGSQQYAGGAYRYFGQEFSLNPGVGPDPYSLHQSFLGWDTSSLPDNEEIIDVRVVMPGYFDWLYAGHPVGCEVSDEEVELRFFDWPGTDYYPSSLQWVPGDTFAALPMLAHRPYVASGYPFGKVVGAADAATPLYTSPGATQHINKTGWTKVAICTSKFAAGSAPGSLNPASQGMESYSVRESSTWDLVVITTPPTPGTSQILWNTNGWSRVSGLAGRVPGSARAGDLLIAIIAGDSLSGTGGTGSWSTPPSGWTLVASVAPTNHQAPLGVYYKIATDADVQSGAYPFTAAAGWDVLTTGGTIFAVTNFNAGSPIGDLSTDYKHNVNANTGGASIPSVTQVQADAILMAVVCRYTYQTGDVFSAWACATGNPAWTEKYDQNSNGCRPNIGVAYGERYVKTATGLVSAYEDIAGGAVDYSSIAFFINGLLRLEWGENTIEIQDLSHG